MTSRLIRLLLAVEAAAAAEFSPAAALRGALLSDAEAAAHGETGEVVFDLAKVSRAFPDRGRSATERLGGYEASVCGPGEVLDLAFGGSSDEHSPRQQLLQQWLFGRCSRLPQSGSEAGMRQECVKRLATYAGVLQGAPHRGTARLDGELAELKKLAVLRTEAVAVLGLARRSSYLQRLGPGVRTEAQELAEAMQAGRADPVLRELLKRPEVARAMEQIAADPSAAAWHQAQGTPDVLEALSRLNALLEK